MIQLSEFDRFLIDTDRRRKHIKEIGFTIIGNRLVKALLPYCPFLEIGAGTGALAAALRSQGGRVIATDGFCSHGKNGWHGSQGKVIKATASRAARLLPQANGLNLLSAWPSSGEDWCTHAVAHLPPGRIFAYIGEGEGGCTGDDSLHELLHDKFEDVSDIDIDNFGGIYDRLFIYRRK